MEILLSNKYYFKLPKMAKKRNRRSTRRQSPSLEKYLRASEAEASQGNETMIETLRNFDNSRSVRGREAVLNDSTHNEIEMQVWTQKVTDKTNKEMAELKKEMNEKLEKVLREVTNSRRTQSIPSGKDNG